MKGSKPNIPLPFYTGILGLLFLTHIHCTQEPRPDLPLTTVPESPRLALNNDETITSLSAFSRGIAAIAKRASIALVIISTSRTIQGDSTDSRIDPFEFFFGPGFKGHIPPHKQEGMGSGFIINLDQGHIITNNHVVEGADEIHIKLANGEIYEGKVAGRDKSTDLAVLKIKQKHFRREGLGILKFANLTNLEPGEFVIALGAPFGLETSVSFGVVSAVHRGNLSITELGDFIQTDAAINPGNSGGPLLNVEGHVVGINTAIFSQSGAYNGIGFAVPSSLAHWVATELIKDGRVDRGYLGIQLRSTETSLANDLKKIAPIQGALVSHVADDGPAKDAGIEEGDIILAVNDIPIKNALDLNNRIGLLSPGSLVKIEILRNRLHKHISVKLDGRH